MKTCFSSSIENFLRLNARQKKGLKKLQINTVKDLLWHFPSRYEQPCETKIIADISLGNQVTISGEVIKSRVEKTWRKKMNLAETIISDGSGTVRVIWFNQPYMANILQPKTFVTITGKVQKNKKGIYIANPLYKIGDPKHRISDRSEIKQPKSLSPIYPETFGVSSRWLQFSIKKILKEILKSNFEDYIPKSILKRYNLPSLKTSLAYIHMPKSLKNIESARKRFVFEEIFFIQLSRAKQRLLQNALPSFKISISKKDCATFINSLPFQLTLAQKKAVERVLEDFKKPSPMARLLEGDVGSGKTVIAMLACFAAVKNNYQTAYMAPTEVLARQHFENFITYFSSFGVKIGLITSSECKKFPSKIKPNSPARISSSQLLKWVLSGEINIIIGTHSLIQEKIKFKNLALVIVDEQHRFGVRQRARLLKKVNSAASMHPHLLSMTATPIPRTLALTIYGDLDLTLIDEMPPDRKFITTFIVPPSNRHRAYEHIREELKKGRQAYVVCPRIEPQSNEGGSLMDPALMDKRGMKAVKEEYKKLSQDIFPEYKIEMLHGKIRPKEKEKIMQNFRNGDTKILVATSVIEVGIDVPNATCILIEGADRFGLAQLHQLRGRVIRSRYKSFCFVFTDSPSKKTLKRLQALKEAKNGFELAEYDLTLRGPGELSGNKQWGISDIAMEGLRNIKMVEAARAEAQKLLKKDIMLKKYPFLRQKIAIYDENLHFE
jgi:ATP-dependent DNA helicase RecG